MASAANDSRFETAKFNHRIEAAAGVCDVLAQVGNGWK